jgi:LacI family transcriptional regulator
MIQGAKNKKARRPTILDIARLAQVSPATVSRVLNDTEYPVKDELCERVRQAAQQLNYKPNIFSQMLKGVSSREIGIIVPDLINPFYAQLVSAVAKQCVAHGFAPIVCSSYDSPKLEDRQIDILLRQQVAGIILSSINNNDNSLKKLTGPGAPPLILFDQSHEGFAGDSVSFDFFKGGYMAASYLIQCGHSNIAFVSHALDRSSRKQIYDGYCQALADAGIELRKEMVLIRSAQQDSEGDVDFNNGRALAQMLLECDRLPDAVMAINDITAIGIMDSLAQRGIKMPRDLSVIGFDNIPVSAMVSPALTTIHQPALKTGREAADLLFARIADHELAPTQITIQPELVVRQSVRKRKKP